MSIKCHYSFVNTGATFAKLTIVKGTGVARDPGTGELKFSSDVEGSCFGYSIDWARRMIEYNGDIQRSRPNKGIGTALQQRWEMKHNAAGGDKWQSNQESVTWMVRHLGLRVVETYRIDDDDLADEVNAESSTVVFDNGLHWMAMSKMNGTRFYFDSNDGLYSVDTQDEYRALVDMFIDDYKNLPGYTNRYDVYSISG